MKFRKKHERPVCWYALSPEYDDSSSDIYHYEPPDSGRDFLYVFCRDAHRAKVLAIRAWRRNWYGGCRTGKTVCRSAPYIVQYNDENPMGAVTIHREEAGFGPGETG